MPLVYALVARAADGAPLARHAAVNGNWDAVAADGLERARRAGGDRFTLNSDGHAFHYLIANGYAFVVAADEAYGPTVPCACARRIADAWMDKFADKGRTAAAGAMDRAFGPVLRRELDYCMAHPEEMSRVAAVQAKVDEVKNIMVMNVESVLARGENLDGLVARTDDLRDQAAKFQKQGAQLRKRMCWQNAKMKLCVCSAVLLLVLVIFLAACFGGTTKCFGGGKQHAGGADAGNGGGSGTKSVGGAAPADGAVAAGGDTSAGGLDGVATPAGAATATDAPAAAAAQPKQATVISPEPAASAAPDAAAAPDASAAAPAAAAGSLSNP